MSRRKIIFLPFLILAKFCYPKNYKDEATMWPWQLKDKFLCHDTLSDCNRQKDGWTDI